MHERAREREGRKCVGDEFQDWVWSSAGANLTPEIAGFGRAKKIGQTFGPLLESYFSVLYPKLTIGSDFWALLEML